MGEGDAAGLAAGLGLVVAGAVVSLGADVAGDDVGVEEFELVARSQAAANAIARIAVSSSVARLIDFVIGLLISFFLVRTRLKSVMMIARTGMANNGSSHRYFAGVSAPHTAKPSF